MRGDLQAVLRDADVFIGVSAPGILQPEWIKEMADQPVVFALANPDPEVDPAEAEKYAAVVASGRSDYPNQINNVLAFPGVFRGLLDARASDITVEMLLRAAEAIALTVKDDEVNPNFIIPTVFNTEVPKAVARAAISAGRLPTTAALTGAWQLIGSRASDQGVADSSRVRRARRRPRRRAAPGRTRRSRPTSRASSSGSSYDHAMCGSRDPPASTS